MKSIIQQKHLEISLMKNCMHSNVLMALREISQMSQNNQHSSKHKPKFEETIQSTLIPDAEKIIKDLTLLELLLSAQAKGNFGGD